MTQQLDRDLEGEDAGDPGGGAPDRIVHLDVDGVRLRVFVRAGAPGRVPLLLCNGIGASAELLSPLCEALGDHPTIIFDAPGTGLSSTPVLPPTLRGLARMVVRMLDALGVEEVDVLGLSWGGLLAQMLAWRHPQRVRRLVLVATGAGAAMVPAGPRVLAAMLTPARYRSIEEFTRIAPVLYGPELTDDPGFLSKHLPVRLRYAPSMQGYLWQILALRGFASAAWLHRIRQPTLVLHGTDDPIAPAVNAKILTALLPDATLRLFDGGGHLFLLTRAPQVAPVVLGFVGEG
ncbi:alpha/beta fold hydrolase [Pseudonocardia hispaniensis]|uniref:Alpha/beta fold hydrolase n=1 Tax=Pseudonocardia hispaniensis TaxID=904933 RepID=A0ABW1J7D3_9PSEU